MCRGSCKGDGGCPDCNPEFAAVQKMNTFEWTAWLTQRTAERANKLGMRVASMRTNIHGHDDEADDTDAHLASMVAFRQSFFETANVATLAALEPATSRVHLEPPDPWASALAARARSCDDRR